MDARTAGLPGDRYRSTEFCGPGEKWSAPVQVNDDNVPGNFTNGASDFFPSEAIDPKSGALHVTFYSTRLDSTNQTTNAYDAVSTNGGASFSTNHRITDKSSNESAANGGRDKVMNYGDWEDVAMQGNVEHLVWIDTRKASSLQEEVFTAAVGGQR
ncbi:MAG: hypothetical protein WB609_01965 [Candidatus Cybelea sp.]